MYVNGRDCGAARRTRDEGECDGAPDLASGKGRIRGTTARGTADTVPCGGPTLRTAGAPDQGLDAVSKVWRPVGGRTPREGVALWVSAGPGCSARRWTASIVVAFG